jgi:Zinc carboxypeptidase
MLILGWAWVPAWPAEITGRTPKDADPADHAFPALGVPANRKVLVEWNQYYDHAGLSAILARLHKAFPDLTRLYSLGTSVEGRDLWCLEVTAKKVGDPKRKPGMYIDGNIHGNEVQAGEVVAYTAWYLCHQYGRLPQVTDLLDHDVFYLIPTINPDGRDHWFHHAQTTHSSRSGVKPWDDDQDGLVDEDDVDDLDGDGSITMMRIKDPHGRYKPHPQFPDLMVPVGDDEQGEYTLLGYEGLDNDGDGRVNEDPVGGYDMNRNWAWDWQPNYIQRGAHEYPFSLPEPRAVAEFILDHPNIAAFQSYHNFGGMILRSPGRQGGVMRPGDDRVLRRIAEQGEQILPLYRSMIIYKDLYTVWGGEIDWVYGGRGILGFTSEIWNLGSLYKTNAAPNAEAEAAFMKYVLLNDGLVPWKPFDHPTYGKIEIGGLKKQWPRTPVSFLLEEECHRNMAFTLYHADQMPRLSIDEIAVDKLKDDLYRVWVTIRNSRLIPTRSDQDVANHISAPDIVSLSGPKVKVISSGRVTDRFFKRVQPVERRPERVELESIRRRNEERVQFIVSGRGSFKVTVNSVKGGLLTSERELPP